jgi:hypothetical protein
MFKLYVKTKRNQILNITDTIVKDPWENITIDDALITKAPPTQSPGENRSYRWEDVDWKIIDDYTYNCYFDTYHRVLIYPLQIPDPKWKLGSPMTDQELIDAGYETLQKYKDEACDKIDNNTDALISQGYEFDSNTFSLSIEAQINWTGLKNFIDNGLVPFPIALSTKDNKEYSLKQSDKDAFFGGIFTYILGLVNTGRARKLQIQAMTELDDINNFVDDRTQTGWSVTDG